MPLSQHRPALAAILVAVVAVLSVVSVARPVDAAPPTSSPIATRALQDLGTWQGECWIWMKKVVFEATGKTIGYDYRAGYLEAGAVEVSLSEAGAGDIIQIVDDAWSTPDADYPGLHTAIILSANGDGTFEAIDSNQNFDGMVALRHAYDPSSIAVMRGLNFHIYRLTGTAPALTPPSAPAVQTVAGPLGAGDKARVNTPGDCLRLRAAPGGTVISCLSHGNQVTVSGAPRTVDGITWVPVNTLLGSGWMASQYLLKEAPAAASPSGSGSVKPVLPFRAVVSIAAD
ncbi:MAG: hypothetical protein U0837_03715 [Dehalococcoidia bacterium]|jgi:hypothetical protein